MKQFSLAVLTCTLAFASTSFGQSDTKPLTQLEYTKWSGTVNVPDPVAISFDEQGSAYVTQTTRRKIQDLDIREHREWIPNDLSLQSVDDKLQFYRQALRPGPQHQEENKKHVQDLNNDGEHDFRDLMVLSEKIHRVEDSDGDGTADRTSVFYESLKQEVTGIAAGVLFHEGDVFATIAPDVVKMRDIDGDGKPDSTETIATGFGLHIAYAGHDMHGLTVGPDGKIYWSVGDKGINVESKEGKRFLFPNQGGVMRCNPDGSDFEVFAHGLRNVQELAFDQYGNLFGFDNDSDQPDERERFMQIVYGMDAGWRCNYQYRGDDYNPWMAERMWEPLNEAQPAFIVPPISNSVNGPCGFAFNPGTALSRDYSDFFFLTSTLVGEQVSFKIQPDRDTFKIENEHKIGEGIPMIGINFGPDGGLYGVDWAGGYPLNQKGAIWKIDAPEFQNSKLRLKTASQLRLDYRNESIENLETLLGSPDQRVRLKSQFELARRRQGRLLGEIANQETKSPANQMARIHAVWALGQIARSSHGEDAIESLISQYISPLLKDPDSMIRMNSARVLGEIEGADGKLLIPLLADLDRHVRVQAALALGRIGTQDAFDELASMAQDVQPTETYLRHAITMGLAGIERARIERLLKETPTLDSMTTERLEKLANHKNPNVRMFGVIAIRKLMVELGYDQRLQVSMKQYLMDEIPAVATEAARAIHDDFSIESALPELARSLAMAPLKSDAYLRRSISANLRLGGRAELIRVAKFGCNESVDPELRFEAIETLEKWAQPAVLDRVTGRHRGKQEPRPFDPALIKTELLNALHAETSKPFRQGHQRKREPAVALITTLRALNIDIPGSELVKIFNSKLPDEIRVEALVSLVKRRVDEKPDPEVASVMSSAIESDSLPIRMAGLRLSANVSPEKAMVRIERLLASSELLKKSSIAEAQLATSLLAKIGSTRSDKLLETQIESVLNSRLDPALHLETLESAATRASENAAIEKLLLQFESGRIRITKSQLSSELAIDELSQFIECYSGGDPKSGETIFLTHIDAQCARCHDINKKEGGVGPNLRTVASRAPAKSDPAYLLRSIVAPSTEIVEKYQTIMLLLESGTTVQGILVRQDEDVTIIVDAAGKQMVVDNDEIDDEAIQKLSMMPQAKTLTKREIRDLVAYLATLKETKRK